MRKASFVFVALILELFAFQNIYSEDSFFKRFENESNPVNYYIRRVVLWRIYIEPLDSNKRMPVLIDSVLRENFHSEKKFLILGKEERLNEIEPNAYYLILTIAGCDTKESKCDHGGRFWLGYSGKDYLLPDTPENRELLSKKFDGLKIVYEYDPRYWDRGSMGGKYSIRKKPNSVK